MIRIVTLFVVALTTASLAAGQVTERYDVTIGIPKHGLRSRAKGGLAHNHRAVA